MQSSFVRSALKSEVELVSFRRQSLFRFLQAWSGSESGHVHSRTVFDFRPIRQINLNF